MRKEITDYFILSWRASTPHKRKSIRVFSPCQAFCKLLNLFMKKICTIFLNGNTNLTVTILHYPPSHSCTTPCLYILCDSDFGSFLKNEIFLKYFQKKISFFFCKLLKNKILMSKMSGQCPEFVRSLSGQFSIYTSILFLLQQENS